MDNKVLCGSNFVPAKTRTNDVLPTAGAPTKTNFICCKKVEVPVIGGEGGEREGEVSWWGCVGCGGL